MSVLDLKVWNDTMSEYPRISYTFYMKKVTSQYTIMRRSKVAKIVRRPHYSKKASGEYPM